MKLETESYKEGIPEERVDVRGRTRRAYSAYAELRDTAGWMQEELTSQLRNFDLTMQEFRVLDILRRGPRYLEEMSRRLRCQKANVAKVLKRLRASGWVRRRRRRLPPSYAHRDAIEIGARPGGTEPRGRAVILIALTEEGRARFKSIHPKHVKLVKAYMRALDQREQLTLTRLCMKLRRGNILKFALEARWWEVDKNWAEVAGER